MAIFGNNVLTLLQQYEWLSYIGIFIFTRCRLQLRLQHSAQGDIRFIFRSQ